jgi:predicted MFS family arabinose efflux permease
MSVGFPIGGTLGGFAAAALISWYSWPAVFLLGAVVAAFCMVLVLAYLPESPAFLLGRSSQPSTAVPYREIFSGPQLWSTIRITSVLVLYILCVYFLLSWTPQMIADAGHSAAAASRVAAVASLAGVVTCLVFGIVSPAARLQAVTACIMIGLGLATLAFGLVPPSLWLLTLMAGTTGAFLYSGVAGLYTSVAATFDSRVRVTGVGFVLGVGRAAGAVAPTLAGTLFANGAGRAGTSAFLGACSVLAGLMLILTRSQRHT